LLKVMMKLLLLGKLHVGENYARKVKLIIMFKTLHQLKHFFNVSY